MTALTDEAVRELTKLLEKLARGDSTPGAPRRGAPSPTGPGGTISAADIDKERQAVAELNKEVEILKGNYRGLTDSISKDYAVALKEAEAASAALRLQILENMAAHEAQTAALQEGDEGWQAAQDEMEAFREKLRQVDADLNQTAAGLKSEQGLTENISRLGQQMLGTSLQGGGLMDKMRGLGESMGKVAADGGSMTSALAKGFKSIGVSILLKPIDLMIQATMQLAGAQDKAISNFRKATGFGKEFNLEMTALERQVFLSGVSIEEVGKAYESMAANMVSFNRLGSDQRMLLGTTISQMNELGVSMETTTDISDKMIQALGMSGTQANDVLLRLAGTAKSIGVPMGQMAQDFQGAFGELAKYGDGAIDVFEGLAVQAKKTGLEVSTLLKLAGQFDTFEGAATQVGKLNAILGGPYLNSIDMLNASEEERIDLLRQSVDAAGVQFEAMNRFEKQAIASALGMSVEEASRIMNMSTAEMELQAMEQEALAEQARNTQELMDQLKQALLGLAVDFRPFMENVVTPLVRAMGEFGKWLGTAETGLGRFIKVGLMAAGLAAMIAAPFTGGTSLAIFAGIAGLMGGIAGAMFTGSGAAAATPAEAPVEDLSGFHMGGTVYGLNKRTSRAIRINEGRSGETAIVPVGTYIANAKDTQDMITGMEFLAQKAEQTNELLRAIGDAVGGEGAVKLVLNTKTGPQSFAATIVREGFGPSGVATPFGVD